MASERRVCLGLADAKRYRVPYTEKAQMLQLEFASHLQCLASMSHRWWRWWVAKVNVCPLLQCC